MALDKEKERQSKLGGKIWMTFTNIFVILLVITVVGVIVWESSIAITERNKLRKFTGEYYDIDIIRALGEMGLSREQALKKIAEQEREHI